MDTADDYYYYAYVTIKFISLRLTFLTNILQILLFFFSSFSKSIITQVSSSIQSRLAFYFNKYLIINYTVLGFYNFR